MKRTITVCDICGSDDVLNRRHYRITVQQFSTINCDYLPGREVVICEEHEAENIPLFKETL